MDPRYLLIKDYTLPCPYERFERWVPPPPNPPVMTPTEKIEASDWHMKNPPLCNCDDPAQLECYEWSESLTPAFKCPNKRQVQCCKYFRCMTC